MNVSYIRPDIGYDRYQVFKNAAISVGVSKEILKDALKDPGHKGTWEGIDVEDSGVVDLFMRQIKAEAMMKSDPKGYSELVGSTWQSGTGVNGSHYETDTVELSVQAKNTISGSDLGAICTISVWIGNVETAGIEQILGSYKFNSNSERSYMERALRDIVNSFHFELSGTGHGYTLSEEEIGLAAGLAAAKAELYAGQSGFGDLFNSTLKQTASDMIDEYIGTINSKLDFMRESYELYKDNPRAVDTTGWYPPLDDDLINEIMQRTKDALLADDGGESFDRLLNEMQEQYHSKANRENVLRSIVDYSRRGSKTPDSLESNYGKAMRADWEQFLADKMADSQSKLGKMLELSREMILKEISSFIAKHSLSDFEAAIIVRDIHDQNWLQRASSQMTTFETEKVADAIKNNKPPTLQDLDDMRASSVNRGPARYDLAGSATSEFKWGRYSELIKNEWSEANVSLHTGREIKDGLHRTRDAMFANA